MNITATHINYYHICHRKLWLFSNGINMEHTSEISLNNIESALDAAEINMEHTSEISLMAKW